MCIVVLYFILELSFQSFLLVKLITFYKIWKLKAEFQPLD